MEEGRAETTPDTLEIWKRSGEGKEAIKEKIKEREKIQERRSKREDQRGRKCLKSLKRKEEIRMPVMQRVFPSEYSDEEIERFG